MDELMERATPLSLGGLQVVLAKIGLVSNNPALLYLPPYLDSGLQEKNPRIWPIVNSIHKVEKIPYSNDMDGFIHILDSKCITPEIFTSTNRVVVSGDISSYEKELENNPSYQRWTLYGNGGILTKLAYTLLEQRYGMLSFHATSLYDESRNEMYLIVGSSGAGKTVIMLEGCLHRGYRVFSTEMTHVNFTPEGVAFYKGSLYDNIRLDTVVDDYPEILEILGIPTVKPEKAGEAKVCVSFTRIQTHDDIIVNPRINYLFPRIEAESSKAEFKDIKDEMALVKMLYDNASENIVRPRIYYSRFALSLIDYPRSAPNRMELCRKLVREGVISQAKSIFAGAKHCMDGVR